MARKNSRASAVFSASTEGKKKSKSKGKGKVRDNVDDAYTFEQELPKRHRTSESKFALSREEKVGGARRIDDEDDDDMNARIRKVAMMIAGDDKADVLDSDDEDVESDDAWDSEGSDEERWGDAFRKLEKGKGKKGKGKEEVLKPAKPLKINLDETDDEESDPEVERSPKTAFKSAFPEEDEDEDEDSDENEDEEDDEEDDEGVDEDDDDDEEDEDMFEDPELPSDLSDDSDEDLDGLDAFVDNLAAADKKSKAQPEVEKKRRVLPVAKGPGLADGGDLALKNQNKVDLSSLIASAPGLAGASGLLPSKKENKSTSVLKGGVLAAPLPTRVQERLDREAAYEQTKQEGQKWSTLMKRVKEAEHLSFPLQATERGGVKSSGEVVATFKPENEHESAVQALLAKANLTDSGVTAAEDAALRGQDLSPEEIAARRAELRHQRELMFRAEAKAKRVAKIKSKTFRKLKRKREAKAAGDGPSLEDLERLDPEAAAEERERLDRERALERATQRHSARNRWASNAAATDEAMEARQDMFDMRDRLRAKVHAKDGSESESSESEDDSDEETIKTRAFDQLSKLDSKLPEVPQKKGLMQMAFMKKAEEREMKKVAEEEANLRRDLEMFGDDSDSGSDSDDAEVLKLGEGRMVFGRAGGDDKPTKAKPAAPATNGSTAAKARSRSPSPAVGVFGDVNPWLDGTNSGPSRKRNKLTATAESKAVGKLKKATQIKDDDEVEISLAAPKASKAAKKAEKAASAPKATESKAPKSILKVKSDVSTEQAKAATSNKRRAADSDSDSDSDADLLPVTGNGPKAFTQRELVAEAFAGDNVIEDFAREKAALIEADAPQTVDTTLPGWGSWGGKGAKKRKTNPKFLKKTAGVAAEDRKDAGRANVIITEKKDKKAARFLPTDLPYPYTSVAQYEAAMAANIGSEFNSRAAFQRGTLPRVTKKPGAIVEPIRKLF